MKQTSNYNLNKPESTDVVNIDDLNTNFDTLDLELKKVSDKANYIQVATGTGTAITINNISLTNGFTVTFLVSANNNGAATTINGKALYKPGGTTAPTLIAGRAVTVWYNGTNFFIKASAEGDAVAANVLAGKKFSNDNDTGLVGTMTDRGAVAITPSNTNQAIAQGYHNGSGYVLGDPDLVTGNIKAGVNIFGVTGKASVVDTADANAVPQILMTGRTAYVNGQKITGTMPGKAATNGAIGLVPLLNIAQDGSMETGVWLTYYGATWDTVNKRYGARSGKLVSATGDYSAITQDLNFPIIAGHVYYASGWFRKSGSLTATGQCDIINGGLTSEMDLFSIDNVTLPNPNTWYLVSGTSVAPSNGSRSTLRTYSFSSESNAVNVDGVVLVDLTAAFGAGNEPSKEQMDNILNNIANFWDGTFLLFSISQGAYLSNGMTGSPEIAWSDAAIRPENILAGNVIHGIAGNIPNLSNQHVPSTVFNGNEIAGRLYVRPPRGYYDEDGSHVYIDDPNYIAANIATGKSIFGLAGSSKRVVSGVASASGTHDYFKDTQGYRNLMNFVQVSGLGFEPSVVVLENNATGQYRDWIIYIKNTVSPGWACIFRFMTSFAFHTNAATSESSAYVNSSGFKIPVWSTAYTYKWTAIE